MDWEAGVYGVVQTLATAENSDRFLVYMLTIFGLFINSLTFMLDIVQNFDDLLISNLIFYSKKCIKQVLNFM